jgi:predicted ester cyclase
MATERDKAAVRRFREAFNSGDLDGAVAVLAPNAIVHLSGAPGPLTVEACKQFGAVIMKAFPGGTATISRLTFRGTHAGDLMGIAPTGKSVTVSEIIIDRFVEGKIVESWRLFDQMAMMQQLGVIQAPGQGGG